MNAALDFRPVVLVAGILVTTLGLAMLLPAIVDISAGNEDWGVFAAASLLTTLVGLSLFAATRGTPKGLSTRQALLMTVVSWVALVAFGALPFIWSGVVPTYTDAFFETMSGLTTTGATVIGDLDTAPPGILFWRGLLQWLGGLGIIVMAIAVLPMLQIGGMQLFKAEAFDTAEKILPRATQISSSITLVFIAFTVLCCILFLAAGMPIDDAVVHAMTTVATGGFSTKDESIGFYDSAAIDWITIVFMILGSIPFILYVQMLQGRVRPFLIDSQVRVFLGLLIIATLIAWLMAHWGNYHVGLDGLRFAAFQRGVDHHRNRLCDHRLRPLGAACDFVLLRDHVHRRLRRLDLLRHQDFSIPGSVRGDPPAHQPGDVPARDLSTEIQRTADRPARHRLGDEFHVSLRGQLRRHCSRADLHRSRHHHGPVGSRLSDLQCRPRPRHHHRSGRQLCATQRHGQMGAVCRHAARPA